VRVAKSLASRTSWQLGADGCQTSRPLHMPGHQLQLPNLDQWIMMISDVEAAMSYGFSLCISNE